MNCIECIYYKKTDPDIKYDRCSKHMTNTMPDWRCADGLKQDNRTNEEVLESIKQKEAAWVPDFGHEPGESEEVNDK